MKHIAKEDNFAKCLNLIKTLLINTTELNPLVILKIFMKIITLDFKFNDQNNRKTLEGTIFFAFKHNYKLSNEKKLLFFKPLSEKLTSLVRNLSLVLLFFF